MESVWSVSKLSTESVGSRRELVANLCSHRRRRRNRPSWRQFRRVVGVNTPVGSRDQNCKLAADGCVVRSNPSAVVANSCTHRRRRRDPTKQFRLVGVGGVYWALRAVTCRRTSRTGHYCSHRYWKTVIRKDCACKRI